MQVLLTMLNGGISELLNYLSAHVVTCLVPAFFIAGAMAVLVTKGAVVKYFGAKAKQWVAYGVASISGMLLAVCSCTVLPLFAGIYNLGAGLGPAITFLYSGPAINILAIALTGGAIGWHMGIARGVGAVVFSIVIGLIMAFLFRKEEAGRIADDSIPENAVSEKPGIFLVIFFGVMVAILIVSTSKLAPWIKVAIDLSLINSLAIMVHHYFQKGEFGSWMHETWTLAKMVVPTLLIGVFIVGMVTSVLPAEWISNYVGENTFAANFLASLVGALFYFSTLTEVPIVKGLMDLGMNDGPALALLLAGPAVSIPNLLVVNRIMGFKKTAAYFILVVIMATLTGWLYGAFFA
ncbi:MAG: permease [Syntrophomonadaceae bacterium]|nr:permease [Syntrophomonadaceae bacterium]MDD3890351.1 permease [Syntrophomonadaceae bacterium]MDD4549906.1 permease [Syntrophomonadaceae bacterium]